jgi:hypothetical protein
MSSTRGKTGVATRWTRGEKINTLYGLRVLKCRCSKCKAVLSDTDFYHANTKLGKKALPTCVKCNDGIRLLNAKIRRRKNKGIFVDKSLQPLPTLQQFML